MTQKERLLSIFEERHTLTNHELRHMTPAMYQFPARIKELNEEVLMPQGRIIFGRFDNKDRNKYFYTLRDMTDEEKRIFRKHLEKQAQKEDEKPIPNRPAVRFGAAKIEQKEFPKDLFFQPAA